MGEYTSFINSIKGVDYRGANFIEYNDKGGEIYISFQTVLRFLNEYVNLNSNGNPITKIDWESDKPFYAFSTTISCNLSKCYIYNDYLGTTQGAISDKGVANFQKFRQFVDSKFTKLNETLEKEAGSPSKFSIYPQIGNISYIYINTGYLAELITKNSDNADNKITIKKLLQDICNDLNKALGSVNDFQVTTDPDSNIVTIIDFNQKRIKGLAPGEDQLTTIKVQGLGSFVTNVSAQSSITPEIASMISIGAQKEGSALGEEATSFSRLSEGLIDRVYPEKEIANSTNTNKISTNDTSQFESNIVAYKQLISNQLTVGGTSGKISIKSDDKSNIENIAVELYRACLGKFTTTNQSSTAFIPVKLDLTLSGLSGIKIFQRFNISSDILPYTYKDNFNFITTGVSHEVNNNNQWLTKLSSLIAIKEQAVTSSNAFYVPIGIIETPPSEQTSTTEATTTTSTTNYNSFKPGQTSRLIIPATQMEIAKNSTGQTAEVIKSQQDRFPDKISGYTVTSGIFRNSSGEWHGGFDLSTDIGTKITFKKDVIFKGNRNDPKGYGTYVLVEYNGKGVVLGHLSEVYKGKAKIGDTIKAGELIGKTGNSGKSTGPHLHFHVYKDTKVSPTNAVLPLDYALELLTLTA